MSDTANTHTAFLSLPVVDISGLYSGDPQDRKRAAEQVGRAARDAGFFYVTGHRIPSPRIETLLNRARAYFALPLGEKMRHYIGNSVNHSGYVPEGEERFGDGNSVDRKEAYDIGFEAPADAPRRPLIGSNQWPDMSGFRQDVSAYYKEARELSQVLFRGFALALGLPEESLARRATRSPSQLRLIHYPHDTHPQDNAQGIGSHTDYECFTILLPTAPGLEVINGAGEWIDVPVLPGAFVVNIGDMLEVISGGRFIATRHRVRKVQEERYSFPLFCALDYDEAIEPLVEPLASCASLACGGDHIYAQTQQTFTYLKERLMSGQARLPAGARTIDSFGRQELRE